MQQRAVRTHPRFARLSAAPSAALIAGLLALGCGGGDQADAEFEQARDDLNEAAEGMGDAAAAMRDAMSGMTQGARVERPVDFRELQRLLPERLGGLERTAREGATQGAMGMDISTATATYQAGNGTIDVEILDLGAVAGPALMGLASWMNVRIDREDDSGWERTTRYKDYPAYEKFSSYGGENTGSAEVAFFVAERFMVRLEGDDVSMDQVKKLRDAFEDRDLARMKDREG